MFHSFVVRIFIVCFVLACSGKINTVQAQLNAGDIMFVGFNADGTDGFAFATLTLIPAGTTLYITDNNWNGLTFPATEGTISWLVGAAIPAGNVIVFGNTATGPVTVNFGSATLTGSLNLNVTDESLYCFLGSSPTVPTTFLTAYSSNNFGSGNTLTGTGLTAGTNAVSNSGGNDVCVYVPPSPCSVSIVTCAGLITNSANWFCEDGAGDQSNNGGIDFPSSVPFAPNISVLPIELLFFNAVREDSDRVLLTWATASEINNDFFLLEWSRDGTNWQEIHKIMGAGNSISNLFYSLKDTRMETAISYYKLSQTDLNGLKESLKIISIDGLDKLINKVTLFPNPNHGLIEIIGENIDFQNIQIFDEIGRECMAKFETKVISQNHIQLILNSPKPAIYIVVIGNSRRLIQII